MSPQSGLGLIFKIAVRNCEYLSSFCHDICTAGGEGAAGSLGLLDINRSQEKWGLVWNRKVMAPLLHLASLLLLLSCA